MVARRGKLDFSFEINNFSLLNWESKQRSQFILEIANIY